MPAPTPDGHEARHVVDAHPATAPWWLLLVALLALGALLAMPAAGQEPAPPTRSPLADAVTAEIGRWMAALDDTASGGPTWTEVAPSVRPALDDAQRAAARGFTPLALERLAAAHASLVAARIVDRTPAGDRTLAAFEAEWQRLGGTLSAPGEPASFAGVGPAVVRAVAEAATAERRVYYDASLDYGRNTTPEAGLFYLGAAEGNQQLAALCRAASAPARRPAPTVGSLAAALDALERDLLAAYRPPASIDRHRDFIGASAMLKAARELDAGGWRYGALLRYLQATVRVAQVRSTGEALAADEAQRALDAADAAFASSDTDHSVAEVFVQRARLDGALAPVVANEVLPRYRAALAPAPAPRAAAAAAVTVTLVRWPFT